MHERSFREVVLPGIFLAVLDLDLEQQTAVDVEHVVAGASASEIAAGMRMPHQLCWPSRSVWSMKWIVRLMQAHSDGRGSVPCRSIQSRAQSGTSIDYGFALAVPPITCGGKMKVIAYLEDPAVIKRILAPLEQGPGAAQHPEHPPQLTLLGLKG